MVANSKTSTKITVTVKDSNDIVLEDPSTETGTSSWRDISLTGGSKKIVTVSFGNLNRAQKLRDGQYLVLQHSLQITELHCSPQRHL